MKDYVSQLFDSFSKKEAPEVKLLNEASQTLAIEEILDNLKYIKYDFEKKVLDPARGLSVVHHSDPLKGGDKLNPHVRAVFRVEDAIANLESQLQAQLRDPFADSELDESDNYYRSMHPELSDETEVLKLNGWNYANGEIWDDAGVCSITYNADTDTIQIHELSDPEGIDQELVEELHDVEDLSLALTNFAELDEIATEMKFRFAEFIENCRSKAESVQEDAEDLSLDVPEVPMPVIIDEWEYLASDPEFEGNPTLLYDKNSLVVFIQKDSDPESEESYYANGLLADGTNLEFVSSDLDSLCQRLALNEFPVPTEEAKAALKGMSAESVSESDENKEKLPKLPDGMKYAKDNQEISKLAPEVPDPAVANIEEPEKLKTRKGK